MLELQKLLRVVSSKEVSEICAPLFSFLDINSFIYTEVHDKCYFTLSNREDWVEHFHTHHYKEISLEQIKANRIIIPETVNVPHEQIIDAGESFMMNSIVNIIFKKPWGYQIHGFSSKNKNHYRHYFSNIEIIQDFLFFFREKARDLIAFGKKNMIKISNTDKLNNNKLSMCLDNPIFETRKYYLSGKDKKCYLTTKEYQLVKLLSKGYGYDEISEKMNISVRTLRSYISNAKCRLNVYSTVNILEMFRQSILIA